MKLKILSWNVRGVNDLEKRKVIKNFIRIHRVDMICLQETKVQEMNIEMVHSLGVGRFLNWTALNAEGSAGGILLIWDKSRISLGDSLVGNFSVSRLFRMEEDGFQWVFCEGPPPGPTPTEGATHHCGTPSRLTVSCPGLSPWLTCSCPSGTSHFRISGQIPIDHFFRLRESSILRAKEI